VAVYITGALWSDLVTYWFTVLIWSIAFCRGLASASNKGPRGHSIDPLPAGVRRRVGRKRQNSWVGIKTVEQNSKGSEQ